MNKWEFQLAILSIIIAISCFSMSSTSHESTELVRHKDLIRIVDRSIDSIVVSTVDGKVHLVDKETGTIHWSFSTGSPLVSSSKTTSFRGEDDLVFLPAMDGTILIAKPDEYGKLTDLERTGITAKDLVRQSPFKSDFGTIFIGEKRTHLYGVDLQSGKLVYTTKDGQNPEKYKDNDAISQIVIGRTDYVLSASNPKSGVERFNLTYSEIRVLSGQPGKSVSVMNNYHVDEQGSLECINENGALLWSTFLKAPVVTVAMPTSKSRKYPLVRYTQGQSSKQLVSKSSIYVSKLPSGQEIVIPLYFMKEGRKPQSIKMGINSVPMTGNLEDEDHVAVDPVTQREYKICNNLSDFGCLMEYHMNRVKGQDVCHDKSIIKSLANDAQALKSIPKSMKIVLMIILVALVTIVACLAYIISIQKSKTSQEGDSDFHVQGRTLKDGEGNLIVGSLVVSNEILGYGCQGTVVFSGSLGTRQVAVKRMLKQFHVDADKEIKLLINSDGHPNVVRYFAKESTMDFVYLALELCRGTLADALSKLHSKSPRKSTLNTLKYRRRVLKFLEELSRGVAHLHSIHILHRDLKPHNILISDEDSSGTFLGHPKISDMGLGKQLGANQSSFGNLSNQERNLIDCSTDSGSSARAPGSVGWQAPEILAFKGHLYDNVMDEMSDDVKENLTNNDLELINARRTSAVDVFSLGCIFYNVFVPGAHPFGQWFERERNILLGHHDLSFLNDEHEARALIRSMISRDANNRPAMQEVLDHPLFWPESRTLSFLLDVSDRLEREDRQSSLSVEFERGSSRVFNGLWHISIHNALVEEMEQFRKYNFSTIRDCLRLIRNKRHHYHELPSEIQELLGPLPIGFCYYFTSRFPRLLMYCYEFVAKQFPNEKCFHSYLGASTTRYRTKFQEKMKSPVYRSSKKEDYVWCTRVTKGKPNGWYQNPSAWKSIKGAELSNSKALRYPKIPEEKFHTTLCAYWVETNGRTCKFGNKCHFAHGYVELRIPKSRKEYPWLDESDFPNDLLNIKKLSFPSNMNDESTVKSYKTKVCRFFVGTHGCGNGEHCRFLHPGVDDGKENEIRSHNEEKCL